MQGNTFLKLFFGGAIAYWLYEKYVFASSVTFKIVTVGIDGSIFQPILNLNILISNNSNVTTTISNINASLYSNNDLNISNIVYTQPIIINGKSDINVYLSLEPSIKNVVTTITKMIKNKTGSFKLQGTATVDGILVPFNINYDL
jgi:LEA14-like dessication related protein